MIEFLCEVGFSTWSITKLLPQQILSAAYVNQPAGSDPLDVTITETLPWLDLSSTGGQSSAVSTAVLNPIALAQGTTHGAITVASNLSEVVVPVTVTLTNKASFCDANGDGVTNNTDVAAVQARVGATLGQPSYDYHYDVDRNGAISTQDVSLVSECVVTYGDARRVYLPVVLR